ncbi:MAG: hypothetical protein QOF58_3409 [Pseudonocardiales bacterium]|jgi:hypothetical protein|nr:hypothetical protein [Pseudonocardiales bacterium]
MSETGLVVFDTSMSVPAPLSLQVRHLPDGSRVSVIVVGPLGAVELQIQPSLLATAVGGMSLEFHSRQPMYTSETGLPNCAVLDGEVCYPDGTTLGARSTFERWCHARDGQAVVDELVRRYQATDWVLDEEEPIAAFVVDARPEPVKQLPAAGEVPPWA